ncbi:hypothetical protein [Rhodopseudomonas sp. BAL398]|uniref:hypothetical protein n=1 Tax=Rhodopseudomonas sp. BAL398 TaxID=3034676 RepID=UPI0023E1FD12|nr:hypothetical protein [Rhodopseudomonas sp. BAL398]MDF3814199.1 hypothetical protein [Rhodopseudomonas sp. BAL398]WOK18663.1 hypothetical protein RBJ75_03805 [Rhodopseudomonas sp. BAL398]
MNEFWFTPKLTGYGAAPSTWEGYTLVGALLAVVLVCSFVMVRRGNSYRSIFPLPLRVIAISTVIFLIVCAWKTDGSWG